MRRMALEENRRADGRRCDDVRQISSRAGLLPCTHGSALFTRGETQTIAVVTLGARTVKCTICYLSVAHLKSSFHHSWCT